MSEDKHKQTRELLDVLVLTQTTISAVVDLLARIQVAILAFGISISLALWLIFFLIVNITL